jgi:hypothetical protein
MEEGGSLRIKEIDAKTRSVMLHILFDPQDMEEAFLGIATLSDFLGEVMFEVFWSRKKHG